MKKYFAAKNFVLLLSAVWALSFFSCKSTKVVEKDPETIALYEEYGVPQSDNNFSVYDNDFDETSDGTERYVFFRLYFPNYKNKMCSENMLKGMINAIEVNEIAASHAAIGFSLDDYYYGLTLAGKQQLKIEKCTDTSGNKYMSKCDPDSSIQYTAAMKVTEEEYNRMQEMVENYFSENSIKYSVSRNVGVAFYSIGRKAFNKKEMRRLGAKPERSARKVNSKKNENKFVCSSFIAYVLINCKEDLMAYFSDKQINYQYVLPSDLFYLPDTEKLFSSNWTNYSLVASKYSQKYESLKGYYAPPEIVFNYIWLR